MNQITPNSLKPVLQGEPSGNLDKADGRYNYHLLCAENIKAAIALDIQWVPLNIYHTG